MKKFKHITISLSGRIFTPCTRLLYIIDEGATLLQRMEVYIYLIESKKAFEILIHK